MKKQRQINKGVALVTVVLVILAATSIALMSMKIVTGEIRMSSAFTYNRKAARAAHAVGLQLEENATRDAEKTCSAQKVQSIRNSLSDSEGSFHASADFAMEAVDRATLEEFTGLRSDPVAKASPFDGDLNRRTFLVGTAGNFTLNPQPVAGFSDGDSFARFNMNADSYALIGSPAVIRGAGNNRYYVLSEVNSRVSGFKREFGVYEVQPLSCK